MKKIAGLLEYFPLQFISAVQSHDKVWFSASEYNGLFYMNLDSGKVGYKGMFPGESTDMMGIHSHVIEHEGALYFIPYYSKNIIKYGIETDKYTQYPIEKSTGEPPFWGAAKWKHYVYFWGLIKEEVLRCDLNKGSIERVQNRTEKIDALLIKKNHLWEYWQQSYWWQSYTVVGKCIYITSYSTNLILKIDMEKNEYEYYAIEHTDGITTICAVNGYFIMTDLNDNIFYWKPEQGAYKITNYKNTGIGKADLCQKKNDFIYYALCGEKNILCFDIVEEKLSLIVEEKKECTNDYWGGKFKDNVNHIFMLAGDIWGINFRDSSFWKLCGNKKYIKELSLYENIDEFIRDRLTNYHGILGERTDMFFSLKNYMALIEVLKSNTNIDMERYGEIIYKEL